MFTLTESDLFVKLLILDNERFSANSPRTWLACVHNAQYTTHIYKKQLNNEYVFLKIFIIFVSK